MNKIIRVEWEDLEHQDDMEDIPSIEVISNPDNDIIGFCVSQWDDNHNRDDYIEFSIPKNKFKEFYDKLGEILEEEKINGTSI